MRSPHSPAHSIDLGDDPDPASEIGPRLAAASQTAQGLLTNYLFYGQRRSVDLAQLRTQATAQDRVNDAQHAQEGKAMVERGNRAVRSQRKLEEGDLGGGVRQAEPVGPGLTQDASRRPKLELVEVQARSGRESSSGGVGSEALTTGDALAAGGLTEDPLTRDPFGAAGLGSQTAPPCQPDTRRR